MTTMFRYACKGVFLEFPWTEENVQLVKDIINWEIARQDPNALKRVSFRIRRRYFDLIVKGVKTEEIRTDKPYWSWLLGPSPPYVATFVCGKDVHRRFITRIYKEDPEKVLGRPLSDQGRQDVLSNPAIIIELGAEYPSKDGAENMTNSAKEGEQ